MSNARARIASKVFSESAARRMGDEQERATNAHEREKALQARLAEHAAKSKERKDPTSLSNEQPSEEESEELYKPRECGTESKPWPSK